MAYQFRRARRGMGDIDCSQPGPQESTYTANLPGSCSPMDGPCISQWSAATSQFQADQQAYYAKCSPGQTAQAQADYSNMMMQKYGAQVYGANAPAAIAQAAQWNAAAVAAANALPAPSPAYRSTTSTTATSNVVSAPLPTTPTSQQAAPAAIPAPAVPAVPALPALPAGLSLSALPWWVWLAAAGAAYALTR